MNQNNFRKVRGEVKFGLSTEVQGKGAIEENEGILGREIVLINSAGMRIGELWGFGREKLCGL